MRSILWLVSLLGLYVWVSATGNEQFFIERGKTLYRIVVHWLEDAEIDFHTEKEVEKGKQSKPRRWD